MNKRLKSYEFGNNLENALVSAGEIILDSRNWRVRLGDLEVAMWLLNAWRRFILPLAVSRIRFLAPRFVLIFGMT